MSTPYDQDAGSNSDPIASEELAFDEGPPEEVEAGWVPTKKWIAFVATGAASILANFIISGEFGDAERGMLATLVVSAAAAYFKQNDVTPLGTGVPVKKHV